MNVNHCLNCESHECISDGLLLCFIFVNLFIWQTSQWLEILQRLCIHDNPQIQHRGMVIIFNMLEADAELAKKLMESEILEILTYYSKMEDNPKNQEGIDVARACLSKAMDLGLIKPFTQ